MFTAMERNMEQKRHCTFNVRVRCVRVISFALKNNKYYKFWVIDSPKLSTTQTSPWPVLFNIIFHIIIQTAWLREKFIKRNILALFSLQRGTRNFLSKNFFYRELIKNFYRSSSKVLIILCHHLMKLEFSRHILNNFCNIILHVIPSSGICVILKEWQKGNAMMRAVRQLSCLKCTLFLVNWNESLVFLFWEFKDSATLKWKQNQYALTVHIS